jgi:hypothetical protein
MDVEDLQRAELLEDLERGGQVRVKAGVVH